MILITIKQLLMLYNIGYRGPAYGEALRSNDRLSVQDESIARTIWHDTGLAKLLQKSMVDGMVPVGCNPNIRFYR
jgi:hypothetical protein